MPKFSSSFWGHLPHRTTFTSLGMSFVILASSILAYGDDDLVIFDNDWDEAGGYLGQAALVPFLASPHIKLLGITSVTGDNWRDEGTANVLRYLEELGAGDVPVANGAVFPLVNTDERMTAWESTHGFIFWKGAWNNAERAPHGHPRDPDKVTPPRDGWAHLRPIDESAADFMIREVHAHPHQVIIYEGAPMTNLALAIRLDSHFASLARELVFMGGYLTQLGHPDGFHTDFNFLFDPEAAHIVLSADWPKMISIGDVGNSVPFTRDLLTRMQAHKTPATEYLARNSGFGFPLWEELGAAIIADPSLITKSTDLDMDVDIDHGTSYGRAIVGLPNASPRLGVGKVTIIDEIDKPRFVDEYVTAVQTDLTKKH